MLSRAQQILLKRAQAEAGMDDVEYREAIATVSGMPDCRSSTDRRLSDRNADNLLSYFEAIFWRKVDAGALKPSCKANAVFRQRGYWASKNQRGDTSRDRYTATVSQATVNALEQDLISTGCTMPYLRAIQNRMRQGGKEFSLVKYAGALRRTLEARLKRVDQPF